MHGGSKGSEAASKGIFRGKGPNGDVDIRVDWTRSVL